MNANLPKCTKRAKEKQFNVYRGLLAIIDLYRSMARIPHAVLQGPSFLFFQGPTRVPKVLSSCLFKVLLVPSRSSESDKRAQLITQHDTTLFDGRPCYSAKTQHTLLLIGNRKSVLQSPESKCFEITSHKLNSTISLSISGVKDLLHCESLFSVCWDIIRSEGIC